MQDAFRKPSCLVPRKVALDKYTSDSFQHNVRVYIDMKKLYTPDINLDAPPGSEQVRLLSSLGRSWGAPGNPLVRLSLPSARGALDDQRSTTTGGAAAP